MHEAITISDEAAGSHAAIFPTFGFNCYSFQTTRGGEKYEALWSHPNFASGTERPSRSGIPILFPFAGRIRQGRFEFGGQHFQLPDGDGQGNAIHGFVLSRPWRVIEHTASSVTGQFHFSVDAADIVNQWPADFRINVTYTVKGNSLESAIVIENPDSRWLPCGFGTHPYFRVPTGDYSRRCRVRVPVRRRWELVDLLPTGRVLDYADAGLSNAGVPFAEMKFDDVFTGLEFRDGRCDARITGLDGGRQLTISFDDQFRECVIFVPPHREAVCIEPYTSMADAFALAAQGRDTGMRLLPPGGCLKAGITISVA